MDTEIDKYDANFVIQTNCLKITFNTKHSAPKYDNASALSRRKIALNSKFADIPYS